MLVQKHIRRHDSAMRGVALARPRRRSVDLPQFRSRFPSPSLRILGCDSQIEGEGRSKRPSPTSETQPSSILPEELCRWRFESTRALQGRRYQGGEESLYSSVKYVSSCYRWFETIVRQRLARSSAVLLQRIAKALDLKVCLTEDGRISGGNRIRSKGLLHELYILLLHDRAIRKPRVEALVPAIVARTDGEVENRLGDKADQDCCFSGQ